MTKARKVEEGEYIDLCWDTHDAEAFFVRGHVTPEVFAKAYDQYHKGPNDRPSDPPTVTHIYARWSFNGDGDFGNGARVMQEYSEPGRGRFKVTRVDGKLKEWCK